MIARTGIVLAAGLGSRLAGDRRDAPLKPLVTVGGIPIIHRVLTGLQRAGCDRTVVVLGYEADRLQRAVSASGSGHMPLRFVQNPEFRLANGISVLSARDLVGPEFVLTMSDHLIGGSLWDQVRELPQQSGGASLLVDRHIDRVFDLDDATKVRTRGASIVDIGKHLETFDAIDTGVFVGTRDLLEALAAVRAQRGDASLSEGVKRLADAGTMRAIDVGEGFWQDVDTPAMLAHAEDALARGLLSDDRAHRER